MHIMLRFKYLTEKKDYSTIRNEQSTLPLTPIMKLV